MIMIGAPVLRREWIIDKYFEHALNALENAGIDEYCFAFLGDYRDQTFDNIREFGQKHKVYTTNWPQSRKEDVREWDLERYYEMVVLRNNLLRIPRSVKPDFFFSLDTDILLHEDAIKNLIESSSKFDAVGGKLYMTPIGKHHPSYGMMLKNGNMSRKDSEGVFRVDVIMAAKLMNPAAYDIDYKIHTWGEDIGWSLAAKLEGVKIGWDGRATSKHVIEPYMLDRVDQRVGF